MEIEIIEKLIVVKTPTIFFRDLEEFYTYLLGYQLGLAKNAVLNKNELSLITEFYTFLEMKMCNNSSNPYHFLGAKYINPNDAFNTLFELYKEFKNT